MHRNIALVLLLSTSILAAPAYTQEEMFRSQLTAPIYFSGENSGTPGEEPGEPIPVILDLAGYAFPEFEVGDSFSHNFNDQLIISGAAANEVDWALGTPSNAPIGLSSAGIMDGSLNEEGEYNFQVVATHLDADNPAQMIYTIVVNGVTIEITQIAAGGSHTCAITYEQEVWCWGRNNFGQLGNNSDSDSSTPVQVTGVDGNGLLTGVTKVTVQGGHTCAIASESTFCWGRNDFGQLGDGKTDHSSTPVQVVGVDGNGFLTGVTQISSGSTHICAISTSQGTVCWGRNDSGELGDGTRINQSTPVQVGGIEGGDLLTEITQISVGDLYTCAITSSNEAYCWGNNGYGKLGTGDSFAKSYVVKVTGLSNVTHIAAGQSHACAIASGEVWCWGGASHGQLGDGNMGTLSGPVKVLTGAQLGGTYLTGVTQIIAGGSHTCAIASGETFCWGRNNFGQLGISGSDRSTPVQVAGLTGVTQINIGSSHTCAISTLQGSVCWGRNNYGQLGNNTQEDSNRPVEVSFP